VSEDKNLNAEEKQHEEEAEEEVPEGEDLHKHKKKTGKKVKIPESEYEKLKEESRKADEYFDNYLRIRAEFDNFRKRINKERASIASFAVEEVVSDFLGVLDNLERAMDAAKGAEDFDSLHKGVEITLKDALKVLEKWGVKEVEAMGEEFDPEKHEAFMTVAPASEAEEGKIVDVMRKGYYLKEKLIRPSLVKVARRN
jgi:molecular chaperone GrpE